MVLLSSLLLFSNARVAAQPQCVDYSPALKQMESKSDAFLIEGTSNSKPVEISYLVADDNRERAAGFQNICSRTIEKEQILFVFDKPLIANFHMRNVWGVLDIAFIDESGVIIDVQAMQPYYAMSIHKPTYAPPSPAKYALEARAGYFKEMGVVVGTTKIASLVPSKDELSIEPVKSQLSTSN